MTEKEGSATKLLFQMKSACEKMAKAGSSTHPFPPISNGM
jgi:hypothetical protein